jgi:hypothetical protein
MAVSDANDTITAAISTANNLLTTSLNSITAAANAQFATDAQALNAAMAAAATQEQADSNVAWDNADIDALDAIYNTYLTTVANSAVAFNASEDAAMNTAATGVDAAVATMISAMYAAEAAWTVAVQSASDTFQATNDNAWNTYLATESSAWSQYQVSLTNITTQQQSNLDAAWGQFQASLGTAATVFTGREATAWAAYLQTLAPGQPAGARLAGLPALAGMDPVLLVALQPGAPAPAKVQGTPPPINWGRGTVVQENVYPLWWPGSGTGYKQQIGVDAAGNPIMITYWRAYAPSKIELHYWCHGLTFGGGGPMSFSPGDDSVPAILSKFYKAIGNNLTQGGDIIVGTDPSGVKHSCIIVTPKFNADGSLDPANTVVNTKNGQTAEQKMTLQALFGVYPNLAWQVYTRK